ncbi:MAG: hypothetical protein BVN35_09605 [Proteobacteria bacterium ST_bin11]|nr:MAG: hypothetical protein BVN35_09605 [Proteobacteria bacterium ST_bin11]
MKTLNAPDKSGELLRSGDVLTISGNALVEYQIDGVNQSPVRVASRLKIGPFSSDVQLIISAIVGSVALTFGKDSEKLINLDDKTNNFKTNVCIAIGTSITNAYWTAAGLGDNKGSSYLAMLEIMFGPVFPKIIDSAVSGRTIAEMRANWETDVAPYYDTFDWAILEPGPNSVHAGQSAASMISDLKWIVDALLSNGKPVLFLTPTSSGQMTTGAARTACAELANWVRRYGLAVDNIFFADVYSAVLIGSRDGYPNATLFAQTGDAGQRVHPTYGGQCVMARALHDALPWLKKYPIQGMNRYDHLEYSPNPNLVGDVANGVRNAQIATALNTVASTLPECVSVGLVSGAFASVSSTPLITKSVNADGIPVMQIQYAGASADWARFVVRFGSSDTTNAIPAQIGRYDQVWTAGQTETIGDHFRISGNNNGIYTLINLTAGDSYVTGPAPSAGANYGDLVTDGVATWIWQKRPAAGDVFVGAIPYEITQLTGGIVMSGRFVAGLSADFNSGFAKAYSEVPTLLPAEGVPTPFWPKKGTIFTPELTLKTAPGNDGMRHLWFELTICATINGAATIQIPSNSIRRIIAQ